jgi:hypothetical protein
MAATTVTKALTGFFNQGEGKRPAKVWLDELKALSVDEKAKLAQEVCDFTGDTLMEASK